MQPIEMPNRPKGAIIATPDGPRVNIAGKEKGKVEIRNPVKKAQAEARAKRERRRQREAELPPPPQNKDETPSEEPKTGGES